MINTLGRSTRKRTLEFGISLFTRKEYIPVKSKIVSSPNRCIQSSSYVPLKVKIQNHVLSRPVKMLQTHPDTKKQFINHYNFSG